MRARTTRRTATALRKMLRRLRRPTSLHATPRSPPPLSSGSTRTAPRTRRRGARGPRRRGARKRRPPRRRRAPRAARHVRSPGARSPAARPVFLLVVRRRRRLRGGAARDAAAAGSRGRQRAAADAHPDVRVLDRAPAAADEFGRWAVSVAAAAGFRRGGAPAARRRRRRRRRRGGQLRGARPGYLRVVRLHVPGRRRRGVLLRRGVRGERGLLRGLCRDVRGGAPGGRSGGASRSRARGDVKRATRVSIFDDRGEVSSFCPEISRAPPPSRARATTISAIVVVR